MKKVIPFICALLCLVVVIIWQIFSSSANYYIIAVLVLVLSMLPFLFSYEQSKPSASELVFVFVLVSSLIAIAVISRAVFYLVPQVKPIGAVVIVSGACLGAKRGYLVGAFSAFISNFIFGQGMWTPFQMVALGTVGLISGLVFDKNARRVPLAVAGFLLTFALYGFIVDLSTVLTITGNYSLSSVLAVYGAGVPFSLIFGISTTVFLLLFGEAFIKKINRITTKYGIL